MKKNVYYTVEKELQSIGECEETTGHKNVVVYNVENNEVKSWFSLDLENSDNSKKEIQNWLNDNGFEDEEFNFVQL